MRRTEIFLLILAIGIGPASAEVYNANGFPVNTGASINADIVIVDLNGDGRKEIIAAPDNRMIYAFNPDGSLFFNYTGGVLMSDLGRKPAIADLQDDGSPELVVYGNPGVHYSYLHYISSTGVKINETLVGMNTIISSPGVTRDKIILVGASPGNPAPTSGATGVYAFDASGKVLWYLDIGAVSRYSAIEVGDIDGDGMDEAGVKIDNGADDYRLVVLEVERTGGSVLWEKNVGSRISGVVFEDLNNDSKKDVIIGSGNGVFVWDGSGTLMWSNGTPSTTHSTPAVGDIDWDGVKEVVVGSDQQKSLYALRNGSMVFGFPVSTIQSVWSRPALGDLDGDGKIDIAAGDFGGYVYAWDSAGKPLPGFPFIPTFSSFMSGARIDDIDGDGIAELLIGNNNGNLYAWTTRPEDITPPVTEDDADGLWHSGDMLVHLLASDDISGVAGTYYTLDGSLPSVNSSAGNEVLVTIEGTTTLNYFSIDRAGNREQVKTAYINIDRTPPSSELKLIDRWYSSGVSASLTASDVLSGVAAVSYAIDGLPPRVSYSPGVSINVSTEGIHRIEYFSMDNAGNAEQVKSSLVKIDFTPPGIAISSPSARDYLHSDIIVINFSVLDGLSGISSLTASINGMQVMSGQEFDMLALSVGSHEFTINTSDNAGNTALGKIKFNIISNIDSLSALNDRAIRNGWITSEETASNLTEKLIKAKQKIGEGQKEAANNIIKSYINEVEAQTGKSITPYGADVLTTEAAYVYIVNVNFNKSSSFK